MDTNPPDEDSWIYHRFEVLKPFNSEMFKQPSGLSPKAENLENLDGGRAYYENLAVGKSKDYIKVYIDGQYGYVKDDLRLIAILAASMFLVIIILHFLLPIWLPQ